MAITLSRGRSFAIALALLATGGLAQAADSVRVGSKIDTEGSLLGNLIVQVLEANGIKTTNKLQLGTTKVLRGAITSGEIDIYPEYTGNGAFFFSDEKDPAWKNAQAGFEKVKQLDYDKNKIVWLDAAPANNTWTIAIRQDVADANHLKTLADLGKWINGGGKFKLAASAEFIERPDALPAFQNAYGFKLNQDQLLSLAGGLLRRRLDGLRHRWPGGGAGVANAGGPERRTTHLRAGADRARSGAESARQSA